MVKCDVPGCEKSFENAHGAAVHKQRMHKDNGVAPGWIGKEEPGIQPYTPKCCPECGFDLDNLMREV